MDPWSYTNYRLAANAASSDFHHLAASVAQQQGHQVPAGVVAPTATSAAAAPPLLLHTAANPASTPASAFNPSGFLSPPVSYESVFSPLFHHTTPKPAHFNSTLNTQHRQVLNAAAAATITPANNNKELDYMPQHHTNMFSDNGAGHNSTSVNNTPVSAAAVLAASLTNWQNGNQFGVLPHENTKISSASNTYDQNAFNSHFVVAPTAAQNATLNTINNQLKLVNNARLSPPHQQQQQQQQVLKQPPAILTALPSQTNNYYPNLLAYGGQEMASIYQLQKEHQQHQQQLQQQQQQQQSQQQYVSNIIGSKSNIIVVNNSASESASIVCGGPGKDANKRLSDTNKQLSRQQQQQSCIVALGSPQSKDYRIKLEVDEASPSSPIALSTTKASTQPIFLISDSVSQQNLRNKLLPTTFYLQQPTKAEAKTFPDLMPSTSATNEQYSLPQNTNYYQQQYTNNNHDDSYNQNRSKANSSTESQYSGSASECGHGVVVVPRRASPLHANSQASPLGHVPSPAYPMYNSPINPMASPQNPNASSSSTSSTAKLTNVQMAPQSPLDVTMSRSSAATTTTSPHIAYPSVITRATDQSAAFSGANRFVVDSNNCWNDKSIDYTQTRPAEVVVPAVKPKATRKPRKSRAHVESNVVIKAATQSQSSPIEYSGVANNRVPPTAHNATNQLNVSSNGTRSQTDGYFEADRCTWNMAAASPSKAFTPMSHSYAGNGQYHLPMFNVNGGNASNSSSSTSQHQPQYIELLTQHEQQLIQHHQAGKTSATTCSNNLFNQNSNNSNGNSNVGRYSNSNQCDDETKPKVVVPNIEDELEFLAENQQPQVTSNVVRAGSHVHQHHHHQPPPLSSHANLTQSHTSTAIVHPPPVPAAAIKKVNVPTTQASGFMASYMKFLQGERDTSPPPFNPRVTRKPIWGKAAPAATTAAATATTTTTHHNSKPNNGVVHIQSQQTIVPAPSEDDPRYFPLVKDRKRPTTGDEKRTPQTKKAMAAAQAQAAAAAAAASTSSADDSMLRNQSSPSSAKKPRQLYNAAINEQQQAASNYFNHQGSQGSNYKVI